MLLYSCCFIKNDYILIILYLKYKSTILRNCCYWPLFFRPRRKTKTLMKKDKYPLTAGGLLPGGPGGMVDPSGRIGGPGSITSSQGGAAAAAAAARDMYSSMNGYMPNGYHSAYAAASSGDPNSVYGQSPYGNSGSAALYGRYDTSSYMSSYMNGSYAMSMYGAASGNGAGGGGTAPLPQGSNGAPGGSGSPYGSMQSMSPGGGQASHSPGSAASENGGPTTKTSSSGVPMPSGSPSAGGLTGYNLKREVTPPAGSNGSGPTLSSGGAQQQQPQDLNRMISMYLPGDAAAAAAGDPNAQSRIQSMYAGHYQAMMGGGGPPPSHSDLSTSGSMGIGHHSVHPANSMSMAHM